MKAIGFIISLGLWANLAFGQESNEGAIDLQRFTDEFIGYQDADADYEDLYENLVQIISSPYDVNKVAPEELRLLNILSDRQIENLLTYRKEQGKLMDLYELQVIPEFDLALIARLLPFLKVSDPMGGVNKSFLQRVFSKDHSYLVTRYERTMEKKKGFVNTPGNPPSFLGSPDKMYFRFRNSKAGDFSMGITGEKDAGERISLKPGNHQWGFDFTSFHLQLQNKVKLKNLVLGDFQSQFGQGLVLGGAFGLGKGGESISTTRKSNVGFLPYTSINESAYHRGAAVALQPLDPLRISIFYSRARRDATASESDSLAISAFQSTGYHRTKRELSTRKKVTEQSYGVVAQFGTEKLEAGVIMHAIHFDMPIKRNPTLYNQGAFSGTQNVNAGIFLNFNANGVSFFGEVAQSFQAGRAVLAGLLVSAHRNFELSILYRNYMRNFHTFYSNAFSENTHPQNERGVYWGWKYRWNRQYSINGYVDLFTFPWLAFRRYAPSQGYEWLLRGNYQPSKEVSVFFQVREESKYRNLPGQSNLYLVGEGVKRNFTLHFDYGAGAKLRFRSRIQYNSYNFDKNVTEGIILLQDLSYSIGRFKFTGRHAIFDTDHYDNRQYVFENDAWMAYSLPAYTGVGVRNYVLFEYKVHKHLTLWVRYARTQLAKQGEFGSGEDVIEGNTKNDVKFQARFKF